MNESIVKRAKLKRAMLYCHDVSTGKLKVRYPCEGLCYNIFQTIGFDLVTAFISLESPINLDDYEHYSGSTTYPIESHMLGETARLAFYNHGENEMWNPKHAYGKRRLEFTAFIASQLKQNLERLPS